MILETFDNWRNRFTSEPWIKIFETLEKLGPDTPDGRVEIQGDEIFMVAMGYDTRERANAVFEAHRRKIDIQMALEGSERIEWAPLKGQITKTPYDEQTDVEFFEHPEGALPAGADMRPGMFMILFPEDAHMPALRPTDGTPRVRKVVVKLSVDLVGKI